MILNGDEAKLLASLNGIEARLSELVESFERLAQSFEEFRGLNVPIEFIAEISDVSQLSKILREAYAEVTISNDRVATEMAQMEQTSKAMYREARDEAIAAIKGNANVASMTIGIAEAVDKFDQFISVYNDMRSLMLQTQTQVQTNSQLTTMISEIAKQVTTAIHSQNELMMNTLSSMTKAEIATLISACLESVLSSLKIYKEVKPNAVAEW